MRLFILLLLISIPGCIEARVRISEVAWMGTSVSSDDEWIELFNEDASVNVDGWSLSDGANLNIILSGQISAGSYVVLERTNDDSAPGSAFLIYSGALPNSGATLTLRNGSGTVVDTVMGGEGWSLIGGDNTTKETAQRTNNSWKTAAATPGTGSLSSDVQDNTPIPVAVSSGGGLVSYGIKDYKKKEENSSSQILVTEINTTNIGYIKQPVHFHASSSGLSSTIINSLSHSWNFGDGTVGEGKSTQHTYTEPGKYIVVLESKYKDYVDAKKFIIDIKSVPVIFSRNEKNFIIKNDASYEVDISGYSIMGREEYKFPPYTYLVPGGQIALKLDVVKATESDVIVLMDREEGIIKALGPSFVEVKNKPIYYPPVFNKSSSNVKTNASSNNLLPEVDYFVPFNKLQNIDSEKLDDNQVTNHTSSNSEERSSLISYLGLAGTIALGIIGTLSFGM